MKGYWKRSVALATGWLNNYRYDPFFSTEVNIILLLVALAGVTLCLVAASFNFLYGGISTAILDGIQAGVASHSTSTLGPTIVDQIEAIRTRNLFSIIVIIIGTTVAFGYVIARVTLMPARNALAAQKQFIGNIAHELRTPLSVIKTNTEVALLENNMNAEMKNMLHTNIGELDRISEIINNLLSLSVLVRPEQMQFSEVDLSELATTVVDKFASLSKRGDLQVTVRKSPHAIVWGNPTALQQIFGNLLKNALEYTPKGGQIVVTVTPAATDHVELVIQDSGIGISRKDLFRIFEPFYRAEQSRTRRLGGSGLGLTIVSELLKLHNGKIMIRSAIGRGTSVVVLLPAPKKAAQVGGNEMKEGVNEVAVDFSTSRSR